MLMIEGNNLNIEYIRHIEGMGEGLVLFKVFAKNKRVGQNYHLFYENKKKPPFDVAINPDNDAIEYISFFVQDEKIVDKKIEYRESPIESGISVSDLQLSEKNVKICQFKEFDIFRDAESVGAIDKNIKGDVTAYKINQLNYVLIDEMGNFAGIIMKAITHSEWEEIKSSDVI